MALSPEEWLAEQNRQIQTVPVSAPMPTEAEKAAFEKEQAKEPLSPEEWLAQQPQVTPTEQPELGFFEGIGESITGTRRATPTTESLPDYGGMPELSAFSMAGFKSALGTMMTSPEETVQVIQANFPGVQVTQDEKGNYLLQSSIDGKQYAIKPGFQVSDIPRAAGAIAAFTPAGRAATLTGMAAGAGATQAAIEATQAATGGQFDTGEVATAAVLAPIVPGIVRGVKAVRGARAPIAPVITPEVPAAPMTQTELSKTTRTAAEGGLGSTRATNLLAGQATPDPKVIEAAQRLNIQEYLQPDHLTANQAYRELAQAVKSIPGSQTRAAEIQGLNQVGQRADNLITEIGGTTDLSRLNQAVRTELDQTVTNLTKQADKAYENLRIQVPAQTRGPADNVLGFVDTRIKDLDGVDNISGIEKMVRSKLTPKVNKEGVITQPTYALIDDVRRDIGAAARQKGPFADADVGLAKQLYRLIDEDQGALAGAVGQADNYTLAKGLVNMRKGFEDDMTSLFGKQLDQSLVSKLESATMALSKGDAEKIANILKAIPKDMRQTVTASALNTAFGKATQNGTLNFNTYAKWYEGLLENKQAYAALMTNLPQSARKQLSDLYRVSSNVSKATRERITTGRIQSIQQELQGADTLLANIYGIAKRAAIGLPLEAATASIGLPGAGIASGLTAALTKGKPNILKAADDLIASPEFQRLAVDTVKTNNQPSKAAIKAVLLSKSFKKFADEVKLPREMSERERFIVQSLQAERQFEQESK
jgi:hypothetical protein